MKVANWSVSTPARAGNVARHPRVRALASERDIDEMSGGLDNAAMAIAKMFTLQFVTAQEWMDVAQRYQDQHPATPSTAGIEVEIEQLCQKWVNGRDFCTAFDFFGDHGLSILLQNRAIDWQGLWNWLVAEHPTMPEGVMINFEVWDSINDGVMTGGKMLHRRLILSDGIYAERIDDAGGSDMSNDV
jgi:hypothetical protein